MNDVVTALKRVKTERDAVLAKINAEVEAESDKLRRIAEIQDKRERLAALARLANRS